MGETLKIGGVEVPPGQRSTIDLPFARLYTHTPMTMPVQVVRGTEPGPRLFVTAGLHGDELNGVEVVRRVLRLPELAELKGDVIGVPMVNVLGFIAHSRYLPDRRDLNRSFPGSKKGSLTAQLANLLMEEVVAKATHGIDLHTGGLHRTNLPHVRARLADPETRRLAVAFGAPVMVDADLRDGSLRQAVIEHGKPMLLYEGGEALRFDDLAIRAGVRGIVNVMRAIGMLPPDPEAAAAAAAAAAPAGGNKKNEPVAARSTMWVRAPISGILRATVALGARVKKGEVLGVLGDLYGEHEEPVLSSHSGIVIGRIQLPLVHRGDALFHVARFARTTSAATQLATFQAAMELDAAVPEAAPGGALGPAVAAKNGNKPEPAPESKPEKPAEKVEKATEKAEKPAEKAEKPAEKAEKAEKAAEKAEKAAEKAEKAAERVEKAAEKAEKAAEKAEKSDKPEKSDKLEKGASSRLSAEGDKGKK